jgi:hypothetical protein
MRPLETSECLLPNSNAAHYRSSGTCRHAAWSTVGRHCCSCKVKVQYAVLRTIEAFDCLTFCSFMQVLRSRRQHSQLSGLQCACHGHWCSCSWPSSSPGMGGWGTSSFPMKRQTQRHAPPSKIAYYLLLWYVASDSGALGLRSNVAVCVPGIGGKFTSPLWLARPPWRCHEVLISRCGVSTFVCSCSMYLTYACIMYVMYMHHTACTMCVLCAEFIKCAGSNWGLD